MSSETESAVTRLWTPAGFRDDEWSHADGAEALSGNRRVILPLTAYLALDAGLRAANAGRIGIHILPGEALDAAIPHLGEVPLVSLAFPAFSDGRSYSKAELLRARHGYKGVIRAAGDVLIDQIPLMLRTGFDEFEVTNPTAQKRLEDGRLGGIPFHYQPAAAEAAQGAPYSWRRLPFA